MIGFPFAPVIPFPFPFPFVPLVPLVPLTLFFGVFSSTAAAARGLREFVFELVATTGGVFVVAIGASLGRESLEADCFRFRPLNCCFRRTGSLEEADETRFPAAGMPIESILAAASGVARGSIDSDSICGNKQGRNRYNSPGGTVTARRLSIADSSSYGRFTS